MAFWDVQHFDTSDALNEIIWAESLDVQEDIQPYRHDWQDGEIGAQQAMRAHWRLPWVPDLVGKQWRCEDSLVVVGSAYGPFIKNTHGRHEMCPSAYAQPSAGQFLSRFVEQVVTRRRYYTRVANLSEHAVDDARHLILLDLCRVALVERGNPCDVGGDRVANCARGLSARYVESPVPRAWLWRRFSESEASAVIALGTVAEHGLLRLFATQLQSASIVDSVEPSIAFAGSDDAAWPAKYAHRSRTLKVRSEQETVFTPSRTSFSCAGRYPLQVRSRALQAVRQLEEAILPERFQVLIHSLRRLPQRCAVTYDRLQESFGLGIQKGAEEVVRVESLDAEGGQRCRREVGEVERHQDRGLRLNRRSQHMAITVIRQLEVREAMLVTCDQALGVDLIHQPPRSLQLDPRQIGTPPQNADHPLFVNRLRPAWAIQTSDDQPEKQVP